MDMPAQPYIFERNTGGPENWGQVKKFAGSDTEAGEEFGTQVALSKDTLVVTALEAAPRNAMTFGAGAAYVFDGNAGGIENWGQVKKLTPSDAVAGQHFGHAAAIQGDTMVVSFLRPISADGGAYVFERNAGGPENWGQVKKLTTTDLEYGYSVSVGGTTVAVGALRNPSMGAVRVGYTYIYERDLGGDGNWGLLKFVSASDGTLGNIFGHAVSLSGNMLTVGAPVQNGATGGIYLFQRDAGAPQNWGEVGIVIPSDSATGQYFGAFGQVSLDG